MSRMNPDIDGFGKSKMHNLQLPIYKYRILMRLAI